ncbi:adenylosuccinate lyase [Formosa sp. 4Alg 33]|uniref:adenylosuccinate lyase n=1 Tax=Formosa sp. 4Alg 33 TaxID=3382189 RepID=UPI003D9C3CFB
MTTAQLYEQLNDVDHSREKRVQYTQLILDNPSLIDNLLDILFMVDDRLSCRAGWVLEFACKKNLILVFPYIDKFTSKIHLVHLDSAVRPVAKICEYLAEKINISENSTLNFLFSKQHKERIISVCFDYMITNEKVATKAYAMSTLYALGKEFPWIHPELAVILERDYLSQSAAYKARARKILKQINGKK